MTRAGPKILSAWEDRRATTLPGRSLGGGPRRRRARPIWMCRTDRQIGLNLERMKETAPGDVQKRVSVTVLQVDASVVWETWLASCSREHPCRGACREPP
jgi:hypothetical protein